MIQVNILGPAEIRKPDGELEQSFLTGPKRLALLVYLLLKRPFGFHRRDSLLPLFWPDMGQKNARNSLSNILYHIRKTFGNDSVLNRGGEEIQINSDLFDCDVNIFEDYLKENRIDLALDLYRGDLLKGFYVSQTSAEFEFWLENERQRLKDKAGRFVSKHIKELITTGNSTALEVYTQRSMELNLPEEVDCLEWVDTLVAQGENQMAQNIYREFCQKYIAEFEEEPSAEFMQKIKEIRNNKLSRNGEIFGEVPSKRTGNRIAVLPFDSCGQESTPTLTEAIHSDILTKLSGLSGLHVISRTSVLGYRGTNHTAPEIASRLNINWILTGEVIEMGSNIKVNVRLINAREDHQIWSESYIRQLNVDNIFKIQSEITHRITNSLRVKLDPVTKQNKINAPAENLESYCLCAQARWYFDQRTETGIRKAIGLFRKALKEDNNYALAWVGLADSLILLQDYGYLPHDEVIQEAEMASRRAYELDPELAETHATLGLLLADKREVSKAIMELNEATKRRPSYSDAFNWIGWFSNVTGDSNKALLNSRKAVELNPLSPEAVSNLSLSYLSNGDYDAAIRQAQQIQVINPDWTTSYFYEALGLYHTGKLDEAEVILKDLVVDWAGNAVDNLLAMIWHKKGNNRKFEKMHKEFQEQNDHFGSALGYCLLKDLDKTLLEMQKITKWNYWNSLALFNLFKNEFMGLEEKSEFIEIKEKAKRSWGV
ncbi:tetratricopeptide repeat protein [Gramella sp. KN1008]|uniref:tetratricopeptide repeat protein n=1 Tax=Gramella sp. KN1008 TaxID=2529298 RepID=UPI00103FBBBB|nr:tetratricopeptide repeat protein [Gramella sp. KN1008]TBW27122.1 hypothetical protein EZJ28_12490 [Gramella sp. KN1008]